MPKFHRLFTAWFLTPHKLGQYLHTKAQLTLNVPGGTIDKLSPHVPNLTAFPGQEFSNSANKYIGNSGGEQRKEDSKFKLTD